MFYNNPLIQQVLRAYKCSPTAFIQQMMAKSNPQMDSIISYVNANGGDAKAAFYSKAEELGINPNSILSQIK